MSANFAQNLFIQLQQEQEILNKPGKWVDESLDTFRSVLNSVYRSRVGSDIVDVETEYDSESKLVQKIVYLYPTVSRSVIPLFILEFTPGKSEVHFTPSEGFNTSIKAKTTVTTNDELTKLLEDWLKKEITHIIPLIS
jgi:hypothetical protein